jgi:hypothetical protein
VGVQEVRWEGEGYKTAEKIYIYISMEKGMLITNYGQDFSYIIKSFQKLKG